MKKAKLKKCRPWAHKWFAAEMIREGEKVTIFYICEKCDSQKRVTKRTRV